MIPLPEPNHAPSDEAPKRPLRDAFPPLSIGEWREQQRQWQALPMRMKVSAMCGVTPSRADELLKLVGL